MGGGAAGRRQGGVAWRPVTMEEQGGMGWPTVVEKRGAAWRRGVPVWEDRDGGRVSEIV